MHLPRIEWKILFFLLTEKATTSSLVSLLSCFLYMSAMMVKKKMSDKEDEKEIEQFFISQFSITQKEEVRKPEEGYIERKVIDSIEHKKR